MGKDGMWVDALLDPYELDLQCLFFKMTMAANSESVLKEVLDKNSIVGKNYFFSNPKNQTFRFIKLVKITCVHVLGSIKDE